MTESAERSVDTGGIFMLKFSGVADGAARFLQKNQLSDPALWAKFVDLYRSQPDGENLGWRGEYWGKMMRGATLVSQKRQRIL